MSELFPDTANTLRTLLLSRDATRQAQLFLASTTFFFVIGVALAVALHFELVTPAGDRFSPETYGALFTLHGLFMMHLFFLPALFGVLGNLKVAAAGLGNRALPRLGLLGWYLHLAGGAVLLWVLAAGGVATGFAFAYTPASAATLAAVTQAGSALALGGVLLAGLNVGVALSGGKQRWGGVLRGEGEAEAAFVWAGSLAAAIGIALVLVLIVWCGWGPLQGTYFEVGSRHLILGGLGFGFYFGRLHWRRRQLAGGAEGERSAKVAAAALASGLLLLCIPQLVMGAMGVPRRYNEYAVAAQGWQVVSAIGAVVLIAGCVVAFWSLWPARRTTDSP